MESSDKVLIDIRELSRLTGIAIGTLYHWAADGRLPCVRFSARCLRFKRESILQWIDELIENIHEPQDRPTQLNRANRSR